MPAKSKKHNIQLGDVFKERRGDEIWISDIGGFTDNTVVITYIGKNKIESLRYSKEVVEYKIANEEWTFLFNDPELVGVSEKGFEISPLLKPYPYLDLAPSEARKQIQATLPNLTGSKSSIQLGDVFYHRDAKKNKFWISGETSTDYLVSVYSQGTNISTLEYKKDDVKKLIDDKVWIFVSNETNLIGKQDPSFKPRTTTITDVSVGIGTYFKNTISDKFAWIAAQDDDNYVISLFDNNKLKSFGIKIVSVIHNFIDNTYLFDSVKPELAGFLNKKDVQVGKNLAVNYTFIETGNPFNPFWISDFIPADSVVFDNYDINGNVIKNSKVYSKSLIQNKLDSDAWLFVSDDFEQYPFKPTNKNEFSPLPQATAPTPAPTTPTATVVQATNINAIKEQISAAKSNLGALLFIRSTIPIVNFEEIMEVETNINLAQRKIDELNFELLEGQMQGGDIFDTLFEQSFTDIKNLYEGIYASPSEPVDFFTPDGQRTEYSDAINQLTRTEKFKEWFGDWQLAFQYKDLNAFEFDSSKVVTQNFEPQVVWHGTGSEFSYFKFDTFPATYFAVNQAYSQFFADLHGGGDGFVLPFFLNIRKPLNLTHFGINKISSEQFFTYVFLETGMSKEDLDVNPLFLDPNLPDLETWVYIRNNPKMLQKLKNTKIVDGIHFYETNPNVPQGNLAYSTEVWVIFEANQCKLADINRGDVLLGSLKSFLLEKGGKV